MALYAFSLKKQDTNEKTFTFAGCSSCDKDGCKPFDWYKTMTVTNKDVLIFYKDSDQTDRIQNLMSQPNMECTIVSNKGFAFDCHSTTFYSANNYFTKSYSFDGKKSLVHKNTSELNGHSSTIKFTCVINENSFLTF